MNRYSWPGNIRELKNVLTYALYSMTNSDLLRVDDLPARFINSLRGQEDNQKGSASVEGICPSPSPAAGETHKLSEVSADAEKEAIAQALLRYHYNKTLVAQTLGISRNKLYKKLREYGMLGSEDSDRSLS